MPTTGDAEVGPITGPSDVEAVETVPIEARLAHDNTYDMFASAAAADPDRIAIRYLPSGTDEDEPVDISYRQLIGRVTQTANLFHGLGIGPGKVVAYLLPNIPETYYCLWGGEAAGIVCAINHFLEAEHIGALLHHAKAEVLVLQGPSDFPIWSKLERIRRLAPGLRHVLRVGPGPASEGVADFHESLTDQPSDRLLRGTPPGAGDVAAYFHTGGTTGVPKITPLTHRNEVVMTWCCHRLFSITAEDIIYCGMPLFHGGGIKVGGMFPHAAGATVVLAGPAGFRNPRAVDSFWRVVERYGVTYVPGPPTVYGTLAERPVDADISTLEFVQVSAAPSPRELFRRFRNATGRSLHEAYGLTEATLVTNVNPRGAAPRDGSVGFRIPYMEQRIVQLDGEGGVLRDCDAGEVGVVVVRGPAVFSGYLPPASNDGLWLDGDWLNSGDMGYLDADGYLWITGRAKDMIIRSGHNIDPEAIETPMHEHPAVAYCAAVAKPDAYASEVPIAYVKLAKGAEVTVEELMRHARDTIGERAAVPKQIMLIEDMPLTAVGKIAKNLLRDEAAKLAILEAIAESPALRDNASVDLQRDPARGSTVVVTLKSNDPNLERVAEELLARYTVPTRIAFAAT